MSKTDHYKFVKACTYPGAIKAEKVEAHLAVYLDALNVKRAIVQLKPGWTLDEHPALKRSIEWILEDFKKRNALDARAALDALDALDARAAPEPSDPSPVSLIRELLAMGSGADSVGAEKPDAT